MKFKSKWILEVEAENIKDAIEKMTKINYDVFRSFNIAVVGSSIYPDENKHSWCEGSDFI